jgi:hypothetical protein
VDVTQRIAPLVRDINTLCAHALALQSEEPSDILTANIDKCVLGPWQCSWLGGHPLQPGTQQWSMRLALADVPSPVDVLGVYRGRCRPKLRILPSAMSWARCVLLEARWLLEHWYGNGHRDGWEGVCVFVGERGGAFKALSVGWCALRCAASRSSGNGDSSRRWVESARQLRLSPEQRERLVIVRREHLQKLEAVFSERQSLNLEAIGVLVRFASHYKSGPTAWPPRSNLSRRSVPACCRAGAAMRLRPDA